MKKLILLLLFIPLICFSQLHHSTISSHSLNSSNNEVKVLQTVGQMSPIGNYNFQKTTVLQGFHHPFLRFVDKEIDVFYNIISYPNPFNSSLIIESQEINLNNVEINLFDLSGRFIKTFNTKNYDGNIKLNMEGLQPSEYILNVKGEGVNYSAKVIKK